MSEAVFPIPVDLTVEETYQPVSLELAEEIIVGAAHEYEGPYNVTPSGQEQVLETDGLLMTDNVVIDAMPAARIQQTTTISDYPAVEVRSTGEIYVHSFAVKTLDIVDTPGYVAENAKIHFGLSVSNTAQLDTEAGKTVTPTESEQTAVDAGKYTTGVIKVGAIASDYVGSAVPQKSSADLTVQGALVTAPAGYYASDAAKMIGNATLQTLNVTSNPTLAVDSSGLVTATVSGNTMKQPVASNGYAKTTDAVQVKTTGSGTLQLDTVAGATITPTTSEQTAVAAEKFTTGAVKVGAIPSEYIIPSGTKPITSNGTGIDVTQYAAVDVNVAGASQITKLATQEFTVSTTSTTATETGRITLDSSAYTKNKIIWVHIRDKAGKRAGYFYGTDTFFMNLNAANGSTSALSTSPCMTIRCNASGNYEAAAQNTSAAYGVYAYSLTDAGVLVIRHRYSATYSLTVNGTFVVDVYAIDPTGLATLFA